MKQIPKKRLSACIAIIITTTLSQSLAAQVIGIASIDENGSYQNTYSTMPSIADNNSEILYNSEGNIRVSNFTANTATYIGSGTQARMSANGRYIIYINAGNKTMVYDRDVQADIWDISSTCGCATKNNINISDNGIVIFSDNNGAYRGDITTQEYHMIQTTRETMSISSDGRYILLQGGSDVILYDRENETDIRHDPGTQGHTNHHGDVVYRAPDGSIKLYQYTNDTYTTIAGDGYSPIISDDGMYVVFTSDSPLLPEATNGNGNVYIYQVASEDLALVSIKNEELSESGVGDKSTPSISRDNTRIAFHGHGKNWFNNSQDAQVFFAANPFIIENTTAVNDSFSGAQDSQIQGNILTNDITPHPIAAVEIVDGPIHGIINAFDTSNGDFTYTPELGRCGSSQDNIFPTDTSSSEPDITKIYLLRNENTDEYFRVDNNDHSSGITLSDEVAVRQWIASIPELASHVAYAYDTIVGVGVIDFIHTSDVPSREMYIGNDTTYTDKKQLDGLYNGTVNVRGTQGDTFSYYITDKNDYKSNVAIVSLGVACAEHRTNNDSFTAAEEESITNTVSENDNLPGQGEIFSLIRTPARGDLVFNENDGSFTYTPYTDQCGINETPHQFVFPTDVNIDGSQNIYSLIDYAESREYLVNDSDHTAFIPFSDEKAINTRIQSIPALANLFTYVYDADQNIGVIDFYRENTKWGIGMGDNDQLTQTKDLDGAYVVPLDMSDYFTYFSINKDNGFISNVSRVELNTTCINDAPVAVNDIASTSRNTAVSLSITDNDYDVDNDVLTVTGLTTITGGSFILSGNTVEYTPTHAFCGTGIFSYSLYDTQGLSSAATGSIAVTCTPPLPPTIIPTATTGSTTPVIYGTGTSGTSITISTTTGILLCKSTISSNGTYACGPTVELHNGVYDLIPVSCYPEICSTGATGSIHIDTVSLPPTLISPLSGSIFSGLSDIVLIGTGEGDSNIIISDTSGNVVGQTTTNHMGGRSFILTGINPGIYSYTIQQIDQYNNKSTSITTTYSITSPTPQGKTGEVTSGTAIAQTGIATTGIAFGGGGQGVSTTYSPILPQQPSSPKTLPSNTIFNPTLETCGVERTIHAITIQGYTPPPSYQKALTFASTFDLTQYNGTQDYRPNDLLTREEAARIFSEFATNVLCRKPQREYINNFSDIQQADATLVPYIQQAYELAIFQGDNGGTFRPTDPIARREVIAIIMRLLTNTIPTEIGETWRKPYVDIADQYSILSYREANLTPYFPRKNTIELLYNAYRSHAYELKDVGYILKR